VRGGDEQTGALFSYVDLEAQVEGIIRCETGNFSGVRRRVEEAVLA